MALSATWSTTTRPRRPTQPSKRPPVREVLVLVAVGVVVPVVVDVALAAVVAVV